MAPAERHVPAIDGARALAILAVFVFHAFPSERETFAFVRLGNLGVDAFFVLSGFLITLRLHALLDAKELTTFGRWKIFIARRTARIFPLYYLVLVLLWAFGGALGFTVVRSAWPWLFGYAANVLLFLRAGWFGVGGHFWSLCVEEQFYLLLPPVVLGAARRWLPAIAVAGALVAFVTRLALATSTSGRAAWAWPLLPLHLDAFGAGIVGALLVDASPARARVANVCGGITGIAFVVLASLTKAPYVSASLPTLLVVAVGALLPALWRGEAKAAAYLLGARPLVGLGRISYGVYVIHPFALLWLYRLHVWWLPPETAIRAALAAILTLALATVSWLAFERPLVRLARRVAA